MQKHVLSGKRDGLSGKRDGRLELPLRDRELAVVGGGNHAPDAREAR